MAAAAPLAEGREVLMKDPHVHVERVPMPGFGHAAVRALIVQATGLVPDLPKTVATGCGVRRPIVMTSTIPEAITCLACRDWAHAEYLLWAGMARAAAELAEADPRAAVAAKTTPADLLDEERQYRALAARFEVAR
jgi:hypothetical protein